MTPAYSPADAGSLKQGRRSCYHVTSKATAEDALYDQLREETELTANLVQKGIRQAVEAIKSGVERLKNGQDTSRPTFTADTAVYDKRSATLDMTSYKQ